MKTITTTTRGQRILDEIRRIQPFLEGSLTATKKRCGRQECRCAAEGPIHPTVLLTWKESGRTRTLHVPLSLRSEVAKWVKEWKRLQELGRKMSRAQRRFLVINRNRKRN